MSCPRLSLPPSLLPKPPQPRGAEPGRHRRRRGLGRRRVRVGRRELPRRGRSSSWAEGSQATVAGARERGLPRMWAPSGAALAAGARGERVAAGRSCVRRQAQAATRPEPVSYGRVRARLPGPRVGAGHERRGCQGYARPPASRRGYRRRASGRRRLRGMGPVLHRRVGTGLEAGPGGAVAGTGTWLTGGWVKSCSRGQSYQLLTILMSILDLDEIT